MKLHLFLNYSYSYYSYAPAENQLPTFTISENKTKLYVPVATLSNQDNVKLLQQSKLGFKRKINWNKYQSKVTVQKRNQYLYYIIHPSF